MRVRHRLLGLAIVPILASQSATALPFCDSKKKTRVPPALLYLPNLPQTAYSPPSIRLPAHLQLHPTARTGVHPYAQPFLYSRPPWPPMR